MSESLLSVLAVSALPLCYNVYRVEVTGIMGGIGPAVDAPVSDVSSDGVGSGAEYCFRVGIDVGIDLVRWALSAGLVVASALN